MNKLKKLVNYMAIGLMTIAIVAPAATSAAGLSLTASVANVTSGNKVWASSVNAASGNSMLFSMKITNASAAPATGVMARVTMPSGLSYTPGYSKVYYKDLSGADKVAPVADAIASASGANLGVDIPAGTAAFVTYKATVATTSGSYAPDNQVMANGGVSLSANSATVVAGGSVSGTATATPATSGVGNNTDTTQPQVYLASSLYNVTKGETAYSPSVNASAGDELIYRMTITNRGSSTASILHARAIMPAGVEYVPGYAKLYYEDATGTDKVMPLVDALNGTGNGVILPDLPGAHWFYLTYKVKVSSSTAAGTYAADNQVIGAGISLSDNNGIITVSGNVVPDAQKNLFLSATGYNSTQAKSIGFNNSVSANRGDVIKFHVDFANVGNAQLKNIKLTNALPGNMEFVAGSVKVVLSGNTISTSDSAFSTGVSLGDLSVGATGYIEFSAKVKSDTPSNIAQLTYSANGNADGITGVSSSVTISLATAGAGTTTSLPSTGTATTILALILLAAFISIASYIYMKESGSLNKALKVINR